MAVVTFAPSAFKAAYPEFADVPEARLQALFVQAGATLLDNSDGSIVTNIEQRAALLDLLVAHLATLYGTTVLGASNAGPAGTVGRVASAGEGSVSTSLEYRTAATATEAWYNQTPYGAQFWAMTAMFRSFRYTALGRSGVGHSNDFRNPYPWGVTTK